MMRPFFLAVSALALMFPFIVFGQAPQQMSYQGVARDASGNVLANQNIGLQIDIRQTTSTGTVVYSETHATTTNTFGLFDIKIGNGTPQLGTLGGVDWANGPYFSEVSLDATGGTSYVSMGVSQFLSVPYALYAENSGTPGPQGPTGADGTDGATGPTGADGADGAVGATGPQGPTGADGAVGATGSQGPTGADGAGGSLDEAYDFGSVGAGREIIATDGALKVTGEDGLLVTGTFGSGDAIEVSGAGTRMFFNPNKAAFRAGHVIGTEWDDANVGNYSVAMGGQNTASGMSSTAMGNTTTASGDYSTAMGQYTEASGGYSTAMGYDTKASGGYSTAMGHDTEASGDYSTTMGNNTTASGDHSTAMGQNTYATGINSTAMGVGGTASGAYSTAMGQYTLANGEGSTTMGQYTQASGEISTAMGQFTEASGFASSAMGVYTTARSFSEFVIGSFNTNYVPASADTWNTADRLFVIGNGESSSSKSDAMVVLKNGDMTISGSASKPGGGTWFATSDRRLKKDIAPYTEGLEQLLAIDPVTYHYNEKSGIDTEPEYVGVIAQELKKVAPYMVGTFEKEGTEYYNVDNSAMTYMLINAVKEQQQMIEEVLKQNAQLKAEMEALKRK